MKKNWNLKCLSEYYDIYRPDFDSIYAVINFAIILLVNKEDTVGIVLNPEYIFYDAEQKKVRFSRAPNYKISYEYQVKELLIYLENMAGYAGEYTYTFVKDVREAYYRKGLQECCKVIKQYEDKKHTKEAVIFTVCVFIFQILYYMLTTLRFYE